MWYNDTLSHGGGSETREPYTESTVGVNTYADKSSTRKPHSAVAIEAAKQAEAGS